VTGCPSAAMITGPPNVNTQTQQHVVNEIEALATSTDLSIRQIQAKIGGRASRGIVGEITKRARAVQPAPL
jgi:hypothetical protein